MLAAIVALMAAAPDAAAELPAPHTVAPVTVQALPPTTIERHPDVTVTSPGGADDVIGDTVAFWPSGAYNAGKGGRVTLSCLVDVHGLAEWCKVAAEQPPGLGFGRAALQQRTTFKLKPAQGPTGPVASVMTINVEFKAPDFRFDFAAFEEAVRLRQNTVMGDKGAIDLPMSGNRLQMRPVTKVDSPVWVSAASFEDLAQAYPSRGGGVEGYAAAHCRVERSGRDTGALSHCVTIKEDPHGLGFGEAALGLTSKFRVLPASLASAPRGASLWVDVPIRLGPPGSAGERTVRAPVWLVAIDPAATGRVFPAKAAAQGVTSGRGVARCTVGAAGELTGCAPEAGEPEGLGFSETAAEIAPLMRMNLWSADGAPVEGGVVHVPIRFSLNGG